MALRRFILTCLMFAVILMLSLNVLAQSDLDTVFTAPDETYTVRYPGTWRLDDSDSNFVILSNAGLSLTVFSTDVVATFSFESAAPEEVIANLASLLNEVSDDNIRTTTIGGREAAITSVTFNDTPGVGIVIEMDSGAYGLLIALAESDMLEDNASMVVRIAASYNNPGIANTSTREDTRAISIVEEIAREAGATIIFPGIVRDNDTGTSSAAQVLRGDNSGSSVTSTADDVSGNDDADTQDTGSTTSSAADALRGRGGASSNSSTDDAPDDSTTEDSDSSSTTGSAADALRGLNNNSDSDNSSEPETSEDAPSTTGSAADAIRGATDAASETASPIIVAAPDDRAALDIPYYDATWNTVIDELMTGGYINGEGELLFEENATFAEGQGSHYTGLARRFPHTNVVIAGTVNFVSANDTTIETCGLFARVTTNFDGDALEFVQVGLSNNGEVFYADSPADDTQGILHLEAMNVDLTQAHHLLAVLMDDTITVFLDGNLVFENQPLLVREGIYGIGLTGGESGSRCEGYNVWVYAFD